MNPDLIQTFLGLQPYQVVEQPKRVLMNSVTMKVLDYISVLNFVHQKELSFIISPSKAAVLYRQPTSAQPSHDRFRAQCTNKREVLCDTWK